MHYPARQKVWLEHYFLLRSVSDSNSSSASMNLQNQMWATHGQFLEVLDSRLFTSEWPWFSCLGNTSVILRRCSLDTVGLERWCLEKSLEKMSTVLSSHVIFVYKMLGLTTSKFMICEARVPYLSWASVGLQGKWVFPAEYSSLARFLALHHVIRYVCLSD